MLTDLSRSRRVFLLVLVTMLLHATFWVGMATWLWSREHYQFFPLVLLASFILAWIRLQDVSWKHVPQVTFRVLALGGGAFALFAIATLFQSNWIGVLAAVSSLWALVWFFGGTEITRELRGPVFLLLLAVPLPINLDLRLVITLQKLASASASSLLDMQSIRHTLSGVAISTLDRNFMVEEACSGVHSLFSCVCVVVFFSVCQRYTLLRVMLNVLQTVGWVIVANTLRVFTIVVASANWDIALDTGWRHDVLGGVTYLVALMLSLSTDRLFHFFVPQSLRAAGGESGETFGAGSSKLKGRFASLRKRWDNWLNRGLLTESSSVRLLVGALLLMFTPLSVVCHARLLARPIAVITAEAPPNFVGNMSRVLNDDAAVPQKIGRWNLVDVQRVSRDAEDPLGTNSTVFTYEGGGVTARFSVDGYYREWHDLAYCYTATGWKLRAQLNSEQNGVHSTELALYMDDGHHAVSLFSCYDSQFHSVVPGEQTIGTIQTIQGLLARFSQATDAPRQSVVPPVLQFQLFCSSTHELMIHEREALLELFGLLSEHSLQALQGRAVQ